MRRATALTLLTLPFAPTACGAASTHAPQTAGTCATTARAELVSIARHIYDQAVNGRNEVAAVRRLNRSAALTRAVAARNRAAVRAALAPIIHHRIVRIQISAGGRTLASVGTVPAYAPVRGIIGRGAGSYVLSVGGVRSFEAITSGLTGARVTFGHGGGATFPATRYPARPSQVHIALPAQPPVSCGATASETRAATIGYVGRNLVQAESQGPSAQLALRHAAKNPAFRRAVASGSPSAVRAAIIGFFRDSRFHIVRVRAWKGARLIGDVGGPFVISPASASIRGPGGAVVGRFMLSVQDDTGYIKLMHRFTGAEVVLHKGATPVPGSNLFPGPPFASGLHDVTYAGRSYRAYGFTAPAFPSGPLKVSLLVP